MDLFSSPDPEVGGPEGRNLIGGYTENEMIAFFSLFAGWELLSKNRDFDGRGLDLLWRYRDPYTRKLEGILVDAKHVEDGRSFSESRFRADLTKVYEKLAHFSGSSAFWQDSEVRGRIDRLKIAITAFRFTGFDRARYQETLRTFDPDKLPISKRAPTIISLANDRIGTFLGLLRHAKYSKVEWHYFDYRQNEIEDYSRVLTCSMMVSDIIPGRYKRNNDYVDFVLTFQEPNDQFFDFFKSFKRQFQFDPQEFLFASGRPDQGERYRRLIDRYYPERAFEILDGDNDLRVNLASEFRK